MKNLFLTIVLVLLLLPIAAEVVGKIQFIVGTVEYKESLNAPYKAASKGMQIHKDGYLKTGLAAKAEIVFDNGAFSELAQNQSISINKLYDEACTSGSWSDKLKRQMKNLSLPNRKETSSVAGIRRDEAEVQKKSYYYWDEVESVDFSAARDMYEQKKYSDAVPMLLKVIEQNPLQPEAEISHLLLILIYEEQQKPIARDKHTALLRKDFPHSQYLELLPGK
ncbi:MAG: hypothetical protein PHY21_05345 [Candidatus Cloacimonetes bacterium]|nr:hypothetical protein [Candidatus Cloacimonadota bacterium]MDD2543634.1 hypothetical protein [Candidatus Cloacimonadota bacterium]MDD2683536.1 hypothetical protein [Candidatus Cloacimonadota bacterium]MDD3577569.1 hypothetical protein [Candidatus Cloacimonadota bacterium]HPF08168.1 hypothetical protein [Candidatus Cloacimonadota bacterium]